MGIVDVLFRMIPLIVSERKAFGVLLNETLNVKLFQVPAITGEFKGILTKASNVIFKQISIKIFLFRSVKSQNKIFTVLADAFPVLIG